MANHIWNLLDDLMAAYHPEDLMATYKMAGVETYAELNPSLTRPEVLKLLAPLNLQVPESFLDLYTWRNGCNSDDCGFQFRDTVFVPLQDAIEFRQNILLDYEAVADEYFNPTYFLPFSHFENGLFYGVQCTPIGTPPPESDAVICVSEGIDTYFYTIESMLRTCIDWVCQDALENEELELSIWRQHNPGIFEETN